MAPDLICGFYEINQVTSFIPLSVTMRYKFSEFNKLGQDSIFLRIGPLRSLNAFYSLLSGEAIVSFGANLLNYEEETVYP